MVAPLNNSTADFDAVVNTLERKLKKIKSIKSKYKNDLIKDIRNYKGTLKIVRGKLILNADFIGEIIKSQKLNNKSDAENRVWKKLFQVCHKKGLIHKRSSYFSIGLSIVSINPNIPSLYSVKLSHIDNYLNCRDTLYDGVEELSLDEKNKVAYRDLRLYQLMPLSDKELSKISTKEITFIDKETAILYIEQNALVQTSIKTYTLIKITGIELVAILKENRDSSIVYPFNSEDIKKDFFSYKNKCYDSLQISAIRMTARNLAILSSSPLQAVIAYDRTILSKMTISELNFLHPNKVPVYLLINEMKRLRYVKKRASIDKESDENEANLFSIKDLDKLQDLLKTKVASEFHKKIEVVKNELLKYKVNPDSTAHGKLIVDYIIWLLERAKKRKKMAISTFKGYIGLLQKHLFSKVEDLSQLQPNELDTIIDSLSRLQYKGKSIRKIRALIMLFFKYHNQNQNIAHIDTASIPKSLIFKEELNEIVLYIANTFGKGTIRQGRNSRFYVLEIQALIILAFYTGLRKNELRSRLLQDISIHDKKIYIDVNSDGLKRLGLKLKTSNAKRRVGATIENEGHLKILKNFLKHRETVKNKSDFLFLEVEKNEFIKDEQVFIKYRVKSKVLPESEFDEIGAILQNLIHRYVSFHSFRHSYATYEVKKILQNLSSNPHELIDLSVRMGHESPETTLRVYVHRSVLEMGGAL